jgi:hypothetical protein
MANNRNLPFTRGLPLTIPSYNCYKVTSTYVYKRLRLENTNLNRPSGKEMSEYM